MKKKVKNGKKIWSENSLGLKIVLIAREGKQEREKARENQLPRGIMWSEVPLPRFIQIFGRNCAVAGQRIR